MFLADYMVHRIMNIIDTSNNVIGFDEFGADMPIESEESFVNGVYFSVDEATASELDRLLSDENIVPTCTVGCSHCCRYHILTNSAEAHTLAQYVKRELSVDQRNDLRVRTQQWHEWDNSRPGRYQSANIDKETDLSNYEHCCPLLVDGACIVYPVRPVVCRTHYSSSPPQSCYAAIDPKSTQDSPKVLTSVVTASNAASMAIRDRIESEGLDFSRSMMLLPNWLAIEMGWDFAISL